MIGRLAGLIIAAGAGALLAAAQGNLEERLAALRPQRPMAYFELGEEIADVAQDQAQRDLARKLFALAGALDTKRLGRSACLALYDLDPDPIAKRRLLMLAALLDERAAASGREPKRPEWADRAAALAVSEAIGHYRRGEGSKAIARIGAPRAADLLESSGAIVFRGGPARFIEECKAFRGGRRPNVSEQDLVTMLRYESAILSDEARSWSGDLLIGSARPLLEVDPDRLAESLGADTTQPCWRAGRWQRCE